MPVQDIVKMDAQERQIFVVTGSIRQRHVKVAEFFLERKVLVAVHREREHGSITAEDGGSAVTLMHVKIDDRDAVGVAIALQHPAGDGDVVEHAETFAAIGKRMMRSAGE